MLMGQVLLQPEGGVVDAYLCGEILAGSVSNLYQHIMAGYT